MKRIKWLLCLLFLNFFCVLHAQSREESALVKTRLVFLGIKGQIREVGLWKEGKFEELRVPFSHFPKAVEYVGANPLILVSMVINEEGKEVPVVVGHAQIPKAAAEVLLLMLPLPPEKGSAGKSEEASKEQAEYEMKAPIRYGIKVVDFSPVVFPENSFLLWNLTGRPLMGTVGEVPFRAEPNRYLLKTVRYGIFKEPSGK